MKIEEYIKKYELKYTPWAESHGIHPPIITKLIRGERVDLRTALKIIKACNNEVTLADLNPELAETFDNLNIVIKSQTGQQP